MLRTISFAIVWVTSGSLPALMIWTWDAVSPIQLGFDDLTVALVGALLGPVTLPVALLWESIDTRRERQDDLP